MTLELKIDGGLVPDSWVTLPFKGSITETANGGAGSGKLFVDDPGGSIVVRDWALVTLEETDCDAPRMFTGWTWNRTVSRGDKYRSGASREWDVDLLDLNELLRFTALQKNRDDAMRPRETGTDRINWLMGTLGMDGIVFDNGEVMANAWIYDESDYRQQYADDVLRDIVSASGVGRWTFFLYWDETAATGEEVSLFYNSVSATVRTSSIRISNVIGDQDADTVYPFVDASLAHSTVDREGGVLVKGVPGLIYRTNPTTIASMNLTAPNGVSLIRDGTYTSDRLINIETMNRHAATYLDWHSLEEDVIACTIQLPKERVNHVRAGDLVSVKFTHLNGYEDFTDERVISRSIVGLSADRSTYTLSLELSLKGVLQSGGGDPGGLPLPKPSCEPTTAQLVSGQQVTADLSATDLILPSDPTEGNTVIVYGQRRLAAADDPDPPIGFTDCGVGLVEAHETTAAAWYRNVQAGDSATISWAGGGSGTAPVLAYAEERVGILTPIATSLVSTDPYNTNSPFPGAAITPGTGKLGAIVGYMFMKRNHGALAADTGWTLLDADTVGAVITHGLVEKLVTSTSGTYTPSFTGANPAVFDNHSYGAITLALLCDQSGDDNPPSPGQWVFQELVTMSGDTGTTQFPYAPGSLHIYVDGIPITSTGYTETDPATGEFTLNWSPDTDEVVRVDYQGI